MLVSALLPWAASGQAQRNGFELAWVADDLGEIEGAGPRALLWTWFAIPALVAGAWLGATFGRRLVVAALTGTVAILAVAAALVVLASPLDAELGPRAALVVGTATAAGAARLAAQGIRR